MENKEEYWYYNRRASFGALKVQGNNAILSDEIHQLCVCLCDRERNEKNDREAKHKGGKWYWHRSKIYRLLCAVISPRYAELHWTPLKYSGKSLGSAVRAQCLGTLDGTLCKDLPLLPFKHIIISGGIRQMHNFSCCFSWFLKAASVLPQKLISWKREHNTMNKMKKWTMLFIFDKNFSSHIFGKCSQGEPLFHVLFN